MFWSGVVFSNCSENIIDLRQDWQKGGTEKKKSACTNLSVTWAPKTAPWMDQYREELCYWYFRANKRTGFFLNVSELLAILSYHLNSKGNWSPLYWNSLMVCGYFEEVFCSLLITDTHRRVTDMAGSQMEHPTHLSVLTIIRSIYWHQSEGRQQTE